MRAGFASSSGFRVLRRQRGLHLPRQYPSETEVLGEIDRSAPERDRHSRATQVSPFNYSYLHDSYL